METKNLNQYKDYYTRNACSIVMLLNIMKYRFAILVIPNFFIKVCVYFDKIWKWSPSWWAVFSVISWAFVKALNYKLKLNFTVVTNKISKFNPSDKRTYWLWIKNYSTYRWNITKKDTIITKDEINYLSNYNWVWHATNWDWSAWWYFIDTDWSKNTKMSLDVLKYWQEKDLFRDNIRTIQPVDKETKEVVKLTVKMFIAEKKNKLESFYKDNLYNAYLEKAKLLYFYWRSV